MPTPTAAASGVTYYNRQLEKARSNFDISHRFVGTFIYELPFGKGRHWGNHGGIVECRRSADGI